MKLKIKSEYETVGVSQSSDDWAKDTYEDEVKLPLLVYMFKRYSLRGLILDHFVRTGKLEDRMRRFRYRHNVPECNSVAVHVTIL